MVHVSGGTLKGGREREEAPRGAVACTTIHQMCVLLRLHRVTDERAFHTQHYFD